MSSKSGGYALVDDLYYIEVGLIGQAMFLIMFVFWCKLMLSFSDKNLQGSGWVGHQGGGD